MSVVVHAYPNTCEAEAGRLRVRGQPRLNSEFEAGFTVLNNLLHTKSK